MAKPNDKDVTDSSLVLLSHVFNAESVYNRMSLMHKLDTVLSQTMSK